MNASSGLLFVALGAFALAVARGRRRPLLLGALAVGFGTNFVVTNVWPSDARWPLAPLAAVVVADAVVAAAGTALAFDVARAASPARRRAFAATAAGIAAIVALAVARVAPQAGDRVGFTAVETTTAAQALAFFGASAALIAGVAVIVAACAHAYPFSSRNDRRALAALAVAFGAWPLYFVPVLVLGPRGSPWDLFLAASVAASLSWATALGGGDPAPARRTLFGLLGLGVLGAVLGAAFGLDGAADYGTPGILRTVAIVLLAIAVFRHDLLGVPLPRLAVHRGPLAAGALAALFVVAQVAQNFLEAQYGLLLGGVVAGAFLFAAHPIQRAIEGRPGAGVVTLSPTPPGDAARREEAYRKALRFALRDGRVSREGELHLHEIAEQLGIPGRRAHELLVEIERAANATRDEEVR